VVDEDADNAMDIAFFSSGGPLRDGRMKPDITAPGTHIQGAASQHPDFDGSGVCGPGSTTDLYFPAGQKLYTWSSGTSHSAPQVAGAAALVRQSLLNQNETPTSALIKALLLNSTTYMTGSLAAGNLPQTRQGWGLIDLDRTFDNASRILVNQSRVLSDSGDEFVLTGEVKDNSRPFRVTLAWSDAPGFSGAAPWVNDLDLEVAVNGQVYRGNNFLNDVSQPGGVADTRNNVEGVWLPAGTAGPFLVRVRGSSIAGDGVPGNSDLTDQDFALVVYNGERQDVGVGVLAAVEVSGGGDAVADPGETLAIKATIRNVSPFQLNGLRGSLTSSTTGVNVSAGTSDFPNLGPGQTGQNTTILQVAVDRSVACGTELQFNMLLTAGQSTSKMAFGVPTGRTDIQFAFSDDVESGGSKWTHHSLVKKKKKQVDTWVLSTKRFRSGASSWFTPNPDAAVNVALDTNPITLPTGRRNLRLVFYHTFQTEPAYDGAVLEISDGGDYVDLGPKILKGGYTGKLLANTTNALQGRDAWTGGRVGVFQEVVVDLDSYAGKTVVIRFHFGTDDLFKELGWFIDDVVVRSDRVTCAP
ncbi:MAG TPA: S8 family serine peptidase, partial [Blastocatellia bacterium]|nr:S8 family serine peptidase [Blastocatellia bacterium]